jgi:valyl-tRNA synthetase
VTQYEAFSKAFEHLHIEKKLGAYWNKYNFYKSSPQSTKKPYTIVMPPPNITGDLTMGHMMFTLQDLLIRWHRAQGYEACWIPGTDHASIATEAKVTKLLLEKGILKKNLSQEEFLKHVWEWKKNYGERIESDLKSLGISCDWSRNTFTMDPHYSAAVRKAIVKLYKDGFIYKSQKLVNWCPVSQSVISDEEVFPQERDAHLWYVRYPVEHSLKEYLVVATTRPETLFGDLALAVNPNDERYAHFVGKYVFVPLCNRKIPVIADYYVEKDFGTGVVKITPAHDPNDFQVGQRHHLGLLNIMNPNATLNDQVPKNYQGLDRFVARQKLIEELAQRSLLEKTMPHKLVVGISERGQVPIEYYLSTQWYIKMETLAQMTLTATRSGRLKLIPSYQEKTWEHWLTNIQDWCISRQLWWGHRMPMYTCDSCGHLHCEEHAPSHCEKCLTTHLTQDPDVLDTWASSWLWPFGVQHWGAQSPSFTQQEDMNYYYPTDVMITGADIIFFWVARMVMAGEYFTGKTPFHTCYFTPIVRDSLGRKMSKSLGNSPDVSKIMRTYGTDAMRFSLIHQIVSGQDIFWKDTACEFGRNFANKLWNAARFLTQNAQKLEINPGNCSFDQLEHTSYNDPLIHWLLSEFFEMVEKSHKHISCYEFSQYTSTLYEFVWMIYCDWFVELIKPLFVDASQKKSSQEILNFAFQIFDGILRILHPIMPFITEEIWLQINPNRSGKSIGFEKLPEPNSKMIDKNALQHMREIQAVVLAVRAIRGKFNIHPGAQLSVYVSAPQSHFGTFVSQMEALAKSTFYFNTTAVGFCAPTLANKIEVFVSLEGFVDKETERYRLLKKIEKINSTIHALEKKLNTSSFVKGAPAHILQGAQNQLLNNQNEIKMLQKSLKLL